MTDPLEIIQQALGPDHEGGLAGILDDVVGFLGRFIVFRDAHQGVAVTLWVAHCYAIAGAHAAAYLRVTSAVEESGKTTLLEVLELLLGEHGINAVSISPAAVFRTRDKVGPVALLLDEIDNTLRNRQDDGARDLLALVNAGYRRSATVIRTIGREHEARRFRAFGPAAIAGVGQLHPTTESRCIPIVLDRKLRGQGERWLPFLVADEARALRERLRTWGDDESLIASLRVARPEIPDTLRDRHAEVWWCLFAIGDLAGGRYPQAARAAALALHDHDAAAASFGVLLLEHICGVFADAGADKLSSVTILRRLVEIEAGPWARWWGPEVQAKETPLVAQSDLARNLRPFGVKPRVVRLPDGTTPRGYDREDFAEPWSRYLPPSEGGATGATTATPLASPVAVVAPVAGGWPREGETTSPPHVSGDDLSDPTERRALELVKRELDATEVRM